MDNQEVTTQAPALSINLFGKTYVFSATFAGPDDEQLAKSVALWKRAGHKTARRRNKQDPHQIDLYASQLSSKFKP